MIFKRNPGPPSALRRPAGRQAGAVLRSAAVCLLAIALGGCAATRVVGEWRSQYYERSIDKVLVIGATNGHERRRLLENGLVDALRKDGITATHSYKLIPNPVGLTRERIEEAIRDQDIETVMMVRLAGIREEETFQQTVERTDELSYFTFSDNTLSRTETGYYEGRIILVLETRVFDTTSQLMIFIMRTELDDTSQSREAIGEQVELTIDRLRSNRLIGN
jgi:hypothetical protein